MEWIRNVKYIGGGFSCRLFSNILHQCMYAPAQGYIKFTLYLGFIVKKQEGLLRRHYHVFIFLADGEMFASKFNSFG